ncbi:hypothetical protein [uncultured Demequina sp.]|uniref:hypothetical protein n=1 Tax=uncultured Demequina sp. TaxID=693499 RepID=UPI0025D66295|nr:hypothetical protein [uncultured Demequina sp.]
MAVVIGEIVTEVVVANAPEGGQSQGSAPVDVEDVVRRATERVLETLRREWDV